MDDESLIEGRTQAVEFIGQLIKEWKETAKVYEEGGEKDSADIFRECADSLEKRIEDFAGM